GPIGLLALQFARAAGAGDVLVIEPSPVRRRLAPELGAMHAVAPGEGAESVQDHTQGVGPDWRPRCAGCRPGRRTTLRFSSTRVRPSPGTIQEEETWSTCRVG